MADKTGTTALQVAMQGGKVSDKAAQSALGQAVGRIASLTRRANESKEAMVETGTIVLHTAETQGSLFLASMAEGYLGEDKLKLGAVDLRGPLALVAQGFGIYQTMKGQKGAGAHVLAIGNGLMASWLANVARNAGRTLAEKRGVAQPAIPPAPAAPPPPVVVMQGAPGLLPEPGLHGPVREVLLTPEGVEGEEVGIKPKRVRKIVRRMERREDRREARQERRAARRGEDEEPDADETQALEGDFDGDDFGRRGGRRGRGRGGRGRGQGRGRFVRADDEGDDDSE